MKRELIVSKYTVEGRPVQIATKRHKLKIVFHTTWGDLKGEVNYSESGDLMLFESRSTYTVYCASSPDMNLQEMITDAKLITWRRKSGKVVLTFPD